MCISSAPAQFTGTKGYVGSVNHPTHGTIHVVGYQNSAVNYADGPNSMILPFPTKKEMGEENVIDLGEHKSLLNDMVNLFEERSRGLGLTKGFHGARKSHYVKVFRHGIYEIILASNATLVPSALARVPANKRPTINKALMKWYDEYYPDHAIAVCCFDNHEVTESDPLFWWYTPRFAGLFFPGVDSHTGGVPDMKSRVDVDHQIVVGYTSEVKHSRSNPFTRSLPATTAAFLSPWIRRYSFEGRMSNGDFKVRGSSHLLERV